MRRSTRTLKEISQLLPVKAVLRADAAWTASEYATADVDRSAGTDLADVLDALGLTARDCELAKARIASARASRLAKAA